MKRCSNNFSMIIIFVAMLAVGQIAFGEALSPVVKVQSKKVCMVNNRLFPNDQIPVIVADKMYYGCCASCKKTLSEKHEIRAAIDPVSKKKVDKAVAIIGATPDGRIFYFESESNLRAYNAQLL